MEFTGVLFDTEDTIFDCTKQLAELAALAMVQEGILFNQEQFFSSFHRNPKQCIYRELERFNQIEMFRKVESRFLDLASSKLPFSIFPIEEVSNTLQFLKNLNIKVGLCSRNNYTLVLEMLASASNIRDYIKCVFGQEFTPQKGELEKYTVSKLGLKFDSVVVVTHSTVPSRSQSYLPWCVITIDSPYELKPKLFREIL